MKRHAAPILAAILLLLPVLYVGSYFALVMPAASGVPVRPPDNSDPYNYVNWLPKTYRYSNSFCERFFWPLEQIDRKVRPGAWEDREWLKPRDNLYRPN